MEVFHLIGIKGTGMCALACALKDLGYQVSGSDYSTNYFTTKILTEKNIYPLEFSTDNITADKIYIASHAYDDNNIEVSEIKKQGYQLYYYSNFIEHFFNKTKIGVSGTHGKTTVTSLIRDFLPKDKTTYIIGDGRGGGVKDYQYFVFEACEYKNHFLNYTFDYLVINNIELDHPDFFKTVDDVLHSFQQASDRAKCLIINGDDSNCQKISHPHKITFGLNPNNDVYAIIKDQHQYGFLIEVYKQDETILLNIPYPGIFMVYNVLACLATLEAMGIKNINYQEKIVNFQKPYRRQEEYFYYDNILIDDYAHHPTEIKMCLQAIKQKYPDKKLIVIFQPHTYSRTLHLLNEFKEAFQDLDIFYLEKTFTSVREQYDEEKEEFILKQFTNAKRFNVQVLKQISKMHNACILFLGAGDVSKHINSII